MKLVLVRHGQSIYNLENKFTGWKDIDLTQQGIDEAIQAGKVLKKYKFKFDIAYTSDLTRAKETLNLILKELNSSLEPITFLIFALVVLLWSQLSETFSSLSSSI